LSSRVKQGDRRIIENQIFNRQKTLRNR